MYALDTTAARESDNFGSYLNETGKYIGQFIRAEKLVSKNKGTHGIGFTFESESKQTTRFDVWTMKPNNEHLMGFKTLQAILTVMRLRGIKPVQGTVERYNYDTKATEKVQAEVFPELMGKPVGLVLRSTEYEKMRDGQLTGETGWRLELVAPFDPQGEFTASEILDKKTSPVKLAALMATLADRPLKTRQSSQRDEYGAPPAEHPASSGFSDPDMDDIPF